VKGETLLRSAGLVVLSIIVEGGLDVSRVLVRSWDSLPFTSELHRSHFDPLAHDLETSGPSAFPLRLDIDPRFWNGGFPPMCRAKSTQPREYRSDAGVRLESRAYSGAVVSKYTICGDVPR
jgi:hypothetical protein